MARQRTRQRSTVQSGYASSETTDGVTFSSGNMMVNGSSQVPEEVQNWESSNGITNYTAVKWNDPATQQKRTSCNCPGWTIAKKGKPRRCKHTDDMEGVKSCNAKRAGTITINTIAEAEANIPRFEGRALRGIMLD